MGGGGGVVGLRGLWAVYPGESFGSKFIPNQTEKKFQSRLMQIGRKCIRLNPS